MWAVERRMRDEGWGSGRWLEKSVRVLKDEVLMVFFSRDRDSLIVKGKVYDDLNEGLIRKSTPWNRSPEDTFALSSRVVFSSQM